MRGRLLIVAALALLVIAVAAGCGGDDGDGTASAANTKAEFVREANALCKKTMAEIQSEGSKVFNEEGGWEDEAEFGRRVIAEVIIPSFEKQIQGIRSLETPAGDQAQVEAILASIQRFIRQLETKPTANEFYPYKEAEAVADKYGLTSCGRPAA